MASKLITGEQAAAAQLLVWPGGAGTGRSTSTNSVSHGQSEIDTERLMRALTDKQSRILELERELETRPKQAYQQGYNEGQTAGAKQANARLEPVIGKLALSLKELAAVRKRHLIDAEEDAVRLAVAVARRVLHRELSVDPESLLGVVKAVFERVDARDVLRIRVHPEDEPILQRHLAAAGMPPRMELIQDSSLERGGVILETNRGSLDASVSSQLKEIEQGLVDLVRRSG